MKKRFTKILAAFALLVGLTIPVGVWGQTRSEVNYVFSDHYSSNTVLDETPIAFDGVITATFNKRSGGTATQYYTNGSAVRWYGGGTLAIVASDATISNIEITYTQTANTVSASVGTYSLSNSVGTWSGSTSSVTFTQSGTSGHCRISAIKVTYSASGSSAVATTVTIDATGITNTDVHSSTEAGQLTATVTYDNNGTTTNVPNATVAWSSSNENVATIDEDGVVTLVAAGTTTITAAYVGESGVYNPSSATYELAVTSSAPYVQPTTIEIIPNYTFWGEDAQFSGDTHNELEGSKDNVTLLWNRGNGSMYANTQAMRFYKDNTLTFTAPEGYEIKSIVLTVSGTYSDLTFAPTGFDNETTTWTGSSETVTMSRPSNASSYATISKFTITIGLPSTDPVITANNVSIEFGATEGEITYAIANSVDDASLEAVVAAGATISNFVLGTVGASPITFTCDANNTTTARTATVTLNYVKNGETLATKDVTVTQAANPNAPLTTMDEIFARATEVGSTATEVTITFNNWIVSGASGRRAYVTDGTKGFPIYDSNDGLNFVAGQILTGTKTCSLQLKNGAAQVSGLNVDDFSDITTGEVTVYSMTIAALNPINTGAVVDLGQLTYNGSKFVDNNNNQIEPYKGLFDYGELESGTKYMVKGVFAYYNVKEILPRSAADIVEVVTPVTSDKYVKVTSTTDLTSGQYLIVYEEGSVAFNGSLETLDVANNTIAVTLNNNTIAVTDATAAAEFTIDVTAGTIKSASGYYIGRTASSNGMNSSTTESYTNSITFDDDYNAVVTSSGGPTLRYNKSSDQRRFRYFGSGQQAIQLYKKVESHTLTIDGYTDVTEGTNNKGYYLIASPVTVDPATVAGMTEGNFDLYYYDQDASDGLEWRNYEANPFNLVPGKGYLYAKKATTESSTYEFTLTGTPYISEIGTVMGWNLIGNPYATAASLNLPFYRMNSEGSALGTETEGNVNYMEGVFVEITPDPETGDMPVVEFSPVNGKSVAALNLNVSQNRGNVIDNAIVRFDNGKTLGKFQLFENSTKLYIPQGNKDYAIVRSAAEAEMPVSFRASENGTYTLAVEAENVEMNYLHLIDNLTGMDVDLLQTPSYTFDAKTSDYASRFRLVFKANGTNENNAETFAYFNGTNWTVSNVGDATLQVVDVTGRTVANQMINGNAELNLNQPAGVYVIRLVNGDNVKTQKVVVR